MPVALVLLFGLASIAQLQDSPLDDVGPLLLEAAPADDQYIEITRVGQPVAPAVHYEPVEPTNRRYPVQPVTAVTTQRPIAAAGAGQTSQFSPADLSPTLTGTSAPMVSAAPSPPVGPILGVSTKQSLFTNGYGGTRAAAVTAAPAPYQPISAPIASPAYAPSPYAGRGAVRLPKPNVPHQPIRNFFRWLAF